MDKERIRDEAEAFFEWPTHDKTHVTTTSMLIFAGVIAGMAAEEAARAEKAWRKDAEAVLEKMAGEGWITEALQAEGVSGIGKALLSLKREARGVLSTSPPFAPVAHKERAMNPYESGAVIDMNAAHKTVPTDAIRAGAKEPSDG